MSVAEGKGLWQTFDIHSPQIETYIEVKGEWKYLYRAVASQGSTLDFVLSAKRSGTGCRTVFPQSFEVLS